MKVDKFGKRIAKIAYHIFGVCLVIYPFVDVKFGYIVFDAVFFTAFFCLCHLTELDEK